ncbi:MAG: TIM barrel protein [Candidatus Aminicenantes bacterium]|nr:TIM barrel protein [Candidatus Aminicenantes bacterium]
MTIWDNRLLFGTAGVPESSAENSTLEGIKHVHALGLDCMEIEFVRGIRLKPDMAVRIKKQAAHLNISLSAHAPYYINLNSDETGKRLVSQERILHSARISQICGVRNLVFHAGYYGKKSPQSTFETIKEGLKEVLSILRSERNTVCLRVETMGKKAQFGSLEEVLFLCREVEGLQPCIDFSHIHAREGKINSYSEFIRIIRKIKKKLGNESVKNMHIHISGAEYNEKGELRHLNLADSDFCYDEWISAVKDFVITGSVISESPVQEQDALMLKKLYYGMEG